MMAGFEEELGVQLFARAKKGVTLTDNGKNVDALYTGDDKSER